MQLLSLDVTSRCLAVSQSLAVVVLVTGKYGRLNQPSGFWVHYNIVIFTYLKEAAQQGIHWLNIFTTDITILTIRAGND